METHEKDFLIKEFETSWTQINHFDNRRATFLGMFNLAFVSTLSLCVNAWTKWKDQPNLTDMLITSLVLIVLLILSRTVIKVLQSEREANVRYRKKINIIRGIFLNDSKDSGIVEYLKRKDLGIKTEKDEHTIDATGSTLKKAFWFIHAQEFFLVVLLLALWVDFLMKCPCGAAVS